MKCFGLFILFVSWWVLSGCLSVPPRETPVPNVPRATPVKLQITGFTADAEPVRPGAAVTLRWSASGAVRAEISHVAEGSTAAKWAVPPTGSLVLPTSEQKWLPYLFALTAYNAAGQATYTTTLVYLHCPYAYFFTLPPKESRWNCAAEPVATSNAVEQVFENGRMIWLERESRVYVLLSDNRLYDYADAWSAEAVDRDPNLVPPAGRYAPAHGFGKVWSADTALRSQLGWALAPEQYYQAQWQPSWSGLYSYVRDFDGRVVRLMAVRFPPGHWELVEQKASEVADRSYVATKP